MRVYVEFAIKKFQNQMAYRLEVFMGIVNTVLTIVVFSCIYRALYGGQQEVDGVTLSMVITNFVISLGLSNAFSFNEMFLQDKLRDGNITSELLKPVNFKFRMLWENIGQSAFKVLFHFGPAVIFGVFFMDICAPYNLYGLIWMAVSVALGYLVLWQLSFIIQTWCFWLFSVWGIITIKNVFVNILAGSMLPIWFMPAFVRNIITYTPFASIYFTPVRIYLGELTGKEIFYGLLTQVFWIVVLYGVGEFFWKKGIKKLVVQGG